jgi:hypothetical protein
MRAMADEEAEVPPAAPVVEAAEEEAAAEADSGNTHCGQ